MGSAAVDVTALFSGLEELCGWYNIIDYNQHCCGQLKVKIASLTQSTYRHTAAPLLLEGAAAVLPPPPCGVSNGLADVLPSGGVGPSRAAEGVGRVSTGCSPHRQ